MQEKCLKQGIEVFKVVKGAKHFLQAKSKPLTTLILCAKVKAPRGDEAGQSKNPSVNNFITQKRPEHIDPNTSGLKSRNFVIQYGRARRG